MREAALTFDKPTFSFFLAYRFLLRYSIIFIVILSPLMVMQVKSKTEEALLSKKCGDYIPCFILYSGFSPDLGFYFSLSMFGFIVIGLFGFLVKWTDFDQHEKLKELVGTKRFPLASLVLDSWDWDYNSRSDQ